MNEYIYSNYIVDNSIYLRQYNMMKFNFINKLLTKHNIIYIIMLRSSMPKTTYLNQNALGYSAEGVLLYINVYLKTIRSTVLTYYDGGGFWVRVFYIDRVLQFFYITKQKINSLIYFFIL